VDPDTSTTNYQQVRQGISVPILIRRLGAATILAVVFSSISISTATAGGTYGSTIQVTTADVTTPADGGCVTPRYTVTNTQASSVDSWTADVEIIAPNGTSYDTDYYSGSESSHDFAALIICDWADAAGTYTVNVRWSLHDSSYNAIGSGMTTGYFNYVKQHKASCRIAFKKWGYGANGWGFRGRLLRNSGPYANRKVDVEVRHAGYWYHVGPKKWTNSRGIAKWHTARRIPRNSYVFRLRFAGDATTVACNSAKFRLPRR
jgi:hypothetical protein